MARQRGPDRGLIDEKQPRSRDFRFGNPDWAALVHAFGWVYCDIARFDQRAPAQEAAAAETALPTLLRMSVDHGTGGGTAGD